MMRMILTDEARRAGADKRKGSAPHIPLSSEIPWVNVNDDEITDLDRAQDELEPVDARKVRVVELRYFLGCTIEESAGALGISPATVERDLNLRRAGFTAGWAKGRAHNRPRTGSEG
jgi:DNA-directed RNA polymerase specialized sigma24 family protein